VKIEILCSDGRHPVMPRLLEWQRTMRERGHAVGIVHDKGELSGGDLLFLVSCAQILVQSERAAFRSVLVLHAGDLPRDRGWSPHVWAILRGESRITVCLLEAQEPADTGAIWARRTFTLRGTELLPEINRALFDAELELMTEAVERFGKIVPEPQRGEPGPYRRRRTPEDSRLDPNKTIADQFELLRVVDAERYPAFFEFRGRRYVVRVDGENANDDR
jgi:methionyl-tRNA formyltransferase